MYTKIPGAPARGLLLWLGTGGALLLGATAMAVLSLTAAMRDTEAMSRGHEAIARLRSAHLALADVEVAVRNRLLLEDPAALAPVPAAGQAALTHLARTQDLLADRPAQPERLHALRTRIQERLAHAQALAEPTPGTEPLRAALAHSARELEAIHDAIGEILGHEERHIAALADAARSGAAARAVAYGAIATLVLLLLLGGYLLARRDARLRDAFQESKDRLALAVVHDLRNPLLAIMGNLDLAAMGLKDPSPDVAHSLAQAGRSARRMVEMVSTIVDVVRLEHGRMPLAPGACDLAQIAAESVTEYQAYAARSGIDLVLEASEPVPIHADRLVVARITENLISNAIKHTPSGGRVTITATAQTTPPGGHLCVEDSGEGIAPADLPRLFTMYGRVEGQRHSTRYDTGLGLVFCRLALEAQGGTIRAESRPGAGAAFHVDLPAAPAAPPATRP